MWYGKSIKEIHTFVTPFEKYILVYKTMLSNFVNY